MGAIQFEAYSDHADVKAAFHACVTQAQFEYGHSGYTGSIAEKDEYVVLDLPDGVDARTAARVLRDSCKGDALPVWLPQKIADEYNDKWGAAVAIRDGQGWSFVGLASY